MCLNMQYYIFKSPMENGKFYEIKLKTIFQNSQQSKTNQKNIQLS